MASWFCLKLKTNSRSKTCSLKHNQYNFCPNSYQLLCCKEVKAKHYHQKTGHHPESKVLLASLGLWSFNSNFTHQYRELKCSATPGELSSNPLEVKYKENFSRFTSHMFKQRICQYLAKSGIFWEGLGLNIPCTHSWNQSMEQCVTLVVPGWLLLCLSIKLKSQIIKTAFDCYLHIEMLSPLIHQHWC